MGILKYQTFEISGEQYVLEKILPAKLQAGAAPVFFDVGANIGEFSTALSKIYPAARIYSFEPSKYTFEKLTANTKQYQNINRVNLGMGSEKTEMPIYTYESELDSGHASVFKDVLDGLHKADKLVEQIIQIGTIKEYCDEQGIEKIDFLKIDTEGFELEVLRGAKQLIDERKITMIQFEFNEMNVVSRVFLKDFYALLKGYEFYRVDTKALIPLYHYQPVNEIFQIQNILAVLKD